MAGVPFSLDCQGIILLSVIDLLAIIDSIDRDLNGPTPWLNVTDPQSLPKDDYIYFLFS